MEITSNDSNALMCEECAVNVLKVQNDNKQ